MTKTTISTLIILTAIFFASCSNPITPVVDVNEPLKSEEKPVDIETPADPAKEAPDVETPAEPADETPAEPADSTDDVDWSEPWDKIKDELNGNSKDNRGPGNNNGNGKDNGNHYGWYK